MLLKKLFFLLTAFMAVSFLAVSCDNQSNQLTNPDPAAELNKGPGEGVAETSSELSPWSEENIIPLSDLDERGLTLEPMAADNAWWWYVNQRIWYYAQRDIGKNVYLQCKPWASRVVYYATGFYLPSTHWSDYYLNAGHCFMIVDGHTVGGGTIERGVGIGNIVQMRIKTSKYTGPHTAIFYRYGVYNGVPGMFWIDSNWFTDDYPCYVYVHFVSFDWFRRYVGTEYSVYQAQNY